MTKATVILEGSGGELDRAEIAITNGDDPDEQLNLAIHAVIENWILSPGDTIRIAA